jgi:hypothetical protein
MKTNQNTAAKIPTALDIESFCNHARIGHLPSSCLRTSHWLEANSKQIVRNQSEHAALVAVAEAARRLAVICGVESLKRTEMDKALANLAAIHEGKAAK